MQQILFNNPSCKKKVASRLFSVVAKIACLQEYSDIPFAMPSPATRQNNRHLSTTITTSTEYLTI